MDSAFKSAPDTEPHSQGQVKSESKSQIPDKVNPFNPFKHDPTTPKPEINIFKFDSIPKGSLFGSGTSDPPQPSIFSTKPATSNNPQNSSSTTSTSAAKPGGGLFGGTQTFGSTSSTPTTKTSGGLFGSTPATKPSSGVFGSAQSSGSSTSTLGAKSNSGPSGSSTPKSSLGWDTRSISGSSLHPSSKPGPTSTTSTTPFSFLNSSPKTTISDDTR